MRNAVEVVESGGASEVAVNGSGDLTIGVKTFSTSDDFIGDLILTPDGSNYSVENFVGTMSGKLGGIDIQGVTIESKDNFSVTSNGAIITAIDNLQNGSFTSDDLNGITIYYGKKSGVSGYNESLKLDLGENFYGINRVTVGGESKNTFFYLQGNGNDTITGANS